MDEWGDPPNTLDLFRPIRRAAYAVLLDVRANTTKRAEVSEWVVRPGAKTPTREMVVAKLPQMDTATGASLPLCEALWSDKSVEILAARMCAFLQCMHVGKAPRLLDTSQVPPKLLLYCCALRYLYIHSKYISSMWCAGQCTRSSLIKKSHNPQ